MPEQESKKEKKLDVWIPFLLSICVILGMLMGARLNEGPEITKVIIEDSDGKNKVIGQGRIEELIRYIEAKYVDKISSDEMIEDAIVGLLGDLDPHTVYMSKEEVREAEEQLEGSFVGIGIEYLLLDDTVTVLKTVPDGPAEKAGMRQGDRIVMIYDKTIVQDSFEVKDVVQLLKGRKGSKIELGISRKGEKEEQRISISRDRIPLHSVDTYYMLNKNAGYIKVNKFSSTTFDEFMDGVDDMVITHKMKDLVIDLRQNGGGYLNEAIKMLNQLFKNPDQLLVYTEGRTVKRDEYFSVGKMIHNIENVIVLIDENTASASEIVAGAIQDWDRGLIIGRRSYGKGLVQEQYKLKDGSALRLTVARYYTPSGRLIQRPYEGNDNYHGHISERLESGELTGEENVPPQDTATFYTSGGRKVYGGGGVSPDIFMPLDSIYLNRKLTPVFDKLNAFVFRHLEENPFELGEEDFIRSYTFSDDHYEQLKVHMQEEGVDMNLDQSLEKEVKRRVKSRIAKQLYSNEIFYRTLNQDDEMITRSLEELDEHPLLSEN